MIENAICNDDGKVALKWVLPRPVKPVKIDGTDRIYIFTYNQHVCMAWVEEKDATRLLNHKEKTCNCNNGTYKNAFVLCNQLDVCLWTTGERC
jgi:hypothetical protein